MGEPKSEITVPGYEVEPTLVAAAIIEKLRIVRRVRSQLEAGEGGRFRSEPPRPRRRRGGRFTARPAPAPSESAGDEATLVVQAHNA